MLFIHLLLFCEVHLAHPSLTTSAIQENGYS
jgi:hypothetical protein